jgi:hypothetical protein
LAAIGLESMGVQVQREFPEDGEHGYDGSAGNVERDVTAEFGMEKYECLRNVLRFFDDVVKE